MRRSEGLVGGIILLVATALALMLSGCGEQERYEQSLARRRSEAFAECARLCGARPVEVRFDSHGYLASCRCDVVISTDAEVE
jgi:hypothetical protein